MRAERDGDGEGAITDFMGWSGRPVTFLMSFCRPSSKTGQTVICLRPRSSGAAVALPDVPGKRFFKSTAIISRYIMGGLSAD